MCSIQSLRRSCLLYFQNVSRIQPLLSTSLSHPGPSRCHLLPGGCRTLLTGFLLLLLSFLQSVLNTASRGVLWDTSHISTALCAKPSHALPISEKPKSSWWLCSLPPRLLDPVFSCSLLTPPTWLYWPPCCCLNKPGTLPPQGPRASLCLYLECSSPDGSLPRLRVSGPVSRS